MVRHSSSDGDGDDNRDPDSFGRRDYDHKTPWPMYVGIVALLASIWWTAAVNVTNAQVTRDNVQQMQTQLNQMRETGAQLRSAVDVINCKVGITCQVK